MGGILLHAVQPGGDGTQGGLIALVREFDRGVRLHDRFQNFGHAEYEKTGERAGRIRLTDYYEYSPVFCASGMGYYEGALTLMKVPGPVKVFESLCQCAGDPACLYEFSW